MDWMKEKAKAESRKGGKPETANALAQKRAANLKANLRRRKLQAKERNAQES